uniref:Uncharacterized protein n=1 Tax=Tetraselmis chuii TaxID=63592 RepID=A0A7S1XB61_9CHLO
MACVMGRPNSTPMSTNLRRSSEYNVLIFPMRAAEGTSSSSMSRGVGIHPLDHRPHKYRLEQTVGCACADFISETLRWRIVKSEHCVSCINICPEAAGVDTNVSL